MKSKGSRASRCVQTLEGRAIESAADVHYQPTSSRPSRQAARALELHCSWGFGGQFSGCRGPACILST